MAFPQNFCQAPCLTPSAANGIDIRMVQRSDGRPPYFQNWSFTVEREIASRINLEVTYLGTKGTRLGSGLIHLNELNPSLLSLGSLLTRSVTSPEAVAAGIRPPYPGFTGSVAQALRPYPQMGRRLEPVEPVRQFHLQRAADPIPVRAFKGSGCATGLHMGQNDFRCRRSCRRRAERPDYV